MENVVSVRELKKYYGKLRAVDGINFDVKKGEILGFLGPNGAGKSTTIRCLMGFNKPTAGVAEVLGGSLFSDNGKLKSQVGYLPGNVKLYDNWTGWDHIRFFENVRGKSANVYDLVKRFDFNPAPRFRHLSSGNKQKLGLILALMNNPKVLILDEPTVGLDPLLQNTIYDVLLEYRGNGTTILISSHNLPEVERLCDRVAIIKEGKLVAVENIKDLGEKKLHKIEIRFKDKYTKEEFEMKGVDKVEEISDGLVLTVSGDINSVLAKLTKHKVLDIEITHASLEDVFLKFYEKK